MKTILLSLFALFVFSAHAVDRPMQELNLESQGCVYLDLFLYDNFGDGWNGAQLFLYNWNYDLVATVDFLDGESYWWWSCLEPGCYYIYVSAGDFPSEISWEAWQDYNVAQLATGTTGYSNWFTLGNPIPGCTDPSACNYDATATCEDYSCCYQCYYLYTYDEFEDGWNGATMNITSTGTGDFSGVYTNGPDTDYELLVGCVTDGCYEVNVTSGDFPSEITWDLYYYEVFGDGFMYVAGGGAPYNDYVGIDGDCCPGCPNADACNYTVFAEGHSASCCYQNCGSLYLYDSFGDGWNGGYVTITDANGNIAHQTSLGAGDSGYEVTCLADGCYTVEVTAGSFSSEVSLYYADWYNYVYVTPGAPASISVGNIITGCMDPTAVNYDPLANCPGDCTTTCPADLDGNGVVNVGDLLLFTASFGTFCY